MCRGPRFFSPDRTRWTPRFWWARGGGAHFLESGSNLRRKCLFQSMCNPPRKSSRGGGATFDSLVPETAPSDCSGPCAGSAVFFARSRPLDTAVLVGPRGGRISSNPDLTSGVSACSKACATPRANPRAGGALLLIVSCRKRRQVTVPAHVQGSAVFFARSRPLDAAVLVGPRGGAHFLEAGSNFRRKCLFQSMCNPPRKSSRGGRYF